MVSAEAMVTDDPFFEITKIASPDIPGSNKPLTYTLLITNLGQPASNLPVVVSDVLPADTSFLAPGPDGFYDDSNKTVTWMRDVSLERGQSSEFFYTVQVGDVPSGTVIANTNYQVANPQSGVTAGAPHTVTVVNPIFSLSKSIWPDPPGSNREMTYTLTLLNSDSLATGLLITDWIPTGVTYMRGGAMSSGVVSWSLPTLDTGGSVDSRGSGSTWEQQSNCRYPLNGLRG